MSLLDQWKPTDRDGMQWTRRVTPITQTDTWEGRRIEERTGAWTDAVGPGGDVIAYSFIKRHWRRGGEVACSDSQHVAVANAWGDTVFSQLAAQESRLHRRVCRDCMAVWDALNPPPAYGEAT